MSVDKTTDTEDTEFGPVGVAIIFVTLVLGVLGGCWFVIERVIGWFL